MLFVFIAAHPTTGNNSYEEAFTVGRSSVPGVGSCTREFTLPPGSAHLDLYVPNSHDRSRRLYAHPLRWSQ